MVFGEDLKWGNVWNGFYVQLQIFPGKVCNITPACPQREWVVWSLKKYSDVPLPVSSRKSPIAAHGDVCPAAGLI